jgi:membrane protease YdiL (CAAX protease family)
MKKQKTTTNNFRKRRIEKRMTGIERALFVLIIFLFAVSFLGLYIGEYMEADAYYQLGMGMVLVAVAILSLEKFFFCKRWKRKVTMWYEISYWLIVAFAIVLALQYEGILNLAILAERSIWMIVPGAGVLWITKLVFDDVAFIDYEARKQAEQKKRGSK